MEYGRNGDGIFVSFDILSDVLHYPREELLSDRNRGFFEPMCSFNRPQKLISQYFKLYTSFMTKTDV